MVSIFMWYLDQYNYLCQTIFHFKITKPKIVTYDQTHKWTTVTRNYELLIYKLEQESQNVMIQRVSQKTRVVFNEQNILNVQSIPR